MCSHFICMQKVLIITDYTFQNWNFLKSITCVCSRYKIGPDVVTSLHPRLMRGEGRTTRVSTLLQLYLSSATLFVSKSFRKRRIFSQLSFFMCKSCVVSPSMQVFFNGKSSFRNNVTKKILVAINLMGQSKWENKLTFDTFSQGCIVIFKVHVMSDVVIVALYNRIDFLQLKF